MLMFTATVRLGENVTSWGIAQSVSSSTFTTSTRKRYVESTIHPAGLSSHVAPRVSIGNACVLALQPTRMANAALLFSRLR
jgi:hypothetical protein